MRQRVVDEWNANQILLRRLDTLFDREGHFTRLAGSKPHVSALIAYDYERRKGKVLTAFNDLGHAVDGDHLVFKIQPLRGNALLRLSHNLFVLLLL